MIVLRTLILIGLLLLIAAPIGYFLGSASMAWMLVAGLSSLLLYHVIYLARLHHWAGLPRQRDLPIGFGSWGQAFDRIGRFMRQEGIERNETAAEMERLHAAVDLLPDGLVVLDRYDHVQWSNRAAQSLHGIFGTRRPIDHFVRQPEFIEYLRTGDFSTPVAMSLPNSPGRVFTLKIVPTSDAYRLLVTHEITETARLEQMRRDFVANVSHEIRTPLTVVAGFVAVLVTIIAMVGAPQAFAGGGKNAYSNPSGSPDEETFETPYANTGGGRMLVFCAEDETLVTLTLADGSLELTCVPAAQ